MINHAVSKAVKQFAEKIPSELRAKSCIIYGSQARGDAKLGSDTDVAVIIEGRGNSLARAARRQVTFDLSDLAFDVLLDTGVDISALPIWQDEWESGRKFINPALIDNIKREGIVLA